MYLTLTVGHIKWHIKWVLGAVVARMTSKKLCKMHPNLLFLGQTMIFFYGGGGPLPTPTLLARPLSEILNTPVPT